MRIVHYRPTAREDLRAIADSYGNIDSDIAARMLADIERTILFLQEFPDMGPAIPGRSLRGMLTRRYRFKIAYRVTRDAITITGIFRFQNRDA